MNRKTPKQDLSKLFPSEPKIFEVQSQPVAHTYRVNMDEEFEHVSQFAQLVDVLEQASENDAVQIRLTGPGGSVAAVLPLLTAMEMTDAFVHVHVDSDIASAATFVLLKAHMVTMNKHVSVMIHTASWGYGGHSGNMEASTNHYVKNIKGLARDVYQDFLSDAEFEKIFNGQELWFTPEEVYQRLKSREDKRIKDEEGEEEEAPKPKAKRTPRKKKEKPSLTDLAEMLEQFPLED